MSAPTVYTSGENVALNFGADLGPNSILLFDPRNKQLGYSVSVAALPQAVTLQPGETSVLSISTMPAGFGYTVTSAVPSVATVSGTTITAVAEGLSTVRVALNGYPSAFAVVQVTVEASLPTISVSPDEVTLTTGETVEIIVTTDPPGLAYGAVSNDTSIVTTTESGVLTGGDEGDTYVRFSLTDYPSVYTDVSVYISNPSVSAFPDSVIISPGQNLQLYVTTSPADLPFTAVSTDTDIVTTTTAGLMTGMSFGSATVVLSLVSFPSSTFSVDVTVASESVSVPTVFEISDGSSADFGASTYPPDQPLGFTSFNTAVANVDGDGVLYGINPGTTIIRTFLSATPTTFARTMVTVVSSPLSLSVEPSYKLLGLTETVQLVPTTSPEGQSVSYIVRAPPKVTVSGTGLVTSIGTGLSVVTSYLTDYLFVSFASKFPLAPENIILNSPSELFLNVGDTFFVDISVFPAGTPYTLISNDTGIATVTAGGDGTAVGSGNCSIIGALVSDPLFFVTVFVSVS